MPERSVAIRLAIEGAEEAQFVQFAPGDAAPERAAGKARLGLARQASASAFGLHTGKRQATVFDCRS